MKRRKPGSSLLVVLMSAVLLAGCGEVSPANTESVHETSVDATLSTAEKGGLTKPAVTDVGETTEAAETLPSEKRAEIEAAEVFASEAERQAAAIIDDSIWYALDVVSQFDHRGMDIAVTTTFVFGYTEDTTLHDALNDGERRILDDLLLYAPTYSEFTFDEASYGSNYLVDYLGTSPAFMYTDPYMDCCFFPVFNGSSIKSSYFDPDLDANYPMAVEEVQAKMEVFSAVLSRVVAKMPEELSAYDRYLYLACVVMDRCSYPESGKEPRNAYTAYGALIGGSAVCEGYAKAFALLCKEADMDCGFAQGTAYGGGHLWNTVTLETGVYSVDLTWADNRDPLGYEFLFYFCVPEETADATGHTRLYGRNADGTKLY